MTPESKHTRKLHSALIEIGKEAESIEPPNLDEIEKAFENLKTAIILDDMSGMRKFGRELNAKVVRWMVEKL